MAINKNFAGRTINKPGAYSKSQTTPDGGGQSVSTDILLLVGEADAGVSGAEEGLQEFSSAAFNELVAKYRSGPLVDAAKVAIAPSKTPGIGGAGKFLIWQTNSVVQASLALANSYDVLKALEYGVGGNRITYKNVLSSETRAIVTASAAMTVPTTETLEVRVNGGSLQLITFATPADEAAVVVAINAGLIGATASEASGILSIEADAIADSHRDGYGQSVEIIGGTGLTLLNLTAGQFGVSAAEFQAALEVNQARDFISKSETLGGDIAIQIGRDDSDSCTAATVAISDSQITLAGTGSDTFVIEKSEFPLISQLVEKINGLVGWSASSESVYSNRSIEDLDQVVSVGAFSEAANKPARIKIDAALFAEFIASTFLVASSAQLELGLPDALAVSNLAGGLKGSSASSDFDAGFSAALAESVNAIVPCISQDAADDASLGLTDAASSYDIDTVIAMLDTALHLRGDVENRKEAQGMVGYRKAAMSDVFDMARNTASSLTQLCILDVKVVDSSNALNWKQPHIFAAMLAGMRLGSEVGEPLTHKTLNCFGIGHAVNNATGIATGDFNPQIHYRSAIDAGVTFAEKIGSGFQIVVDNTTYGIDENFVYNRGSVVEAAQYIAKTIRADAESVFVGRKNSVIDAATIKSRIRTKLGELFADKITSPSSDAPNGYVEETFIVNVVGNTASISVEVKPVQGLDFIFITFTLGETRQSA